MGAFTPRSRSYSAPHVDQPFSFFALRVHLRTVQTNAAIDQELHRYTLVPPPPTFGKCFYPAMNFRESPKMGGVICSSPGNVKKNSRNCGNLIDLYVQLPETISANIYQKFGGAWPPWPPLATPLWISRKMSGITPPPPNLVGICLITQHLPGGIGRVPPPQTKLLATPLHT